MRKHLFGRGFPGQVKNNILLVHVLNMLGQMQRRGEVVRFGS